MRSSSFSPGAALALALGALVCLAAGAAPAAAGPPAPASPPSPAAAAAPDARRAVRQGIAVDLEIQPVDPRRQGALREGEDVVVRFRISDTASGTPLAGASPAAWMDRVFPGIESSARGCQQKVEEWVAGSLFSKPDLDLNTYYVLTLNDDATVTVVDPLFGFGDSKLLAMVFLKSPGLDWALSGDKRRLFVSMPEAGQVAVADTASWQVVANLDAGPRPGRLGLQPDGGYLWVLGEEAVDVFDPAKLVRTARIALTKGAHEIAWSTDSAYAFVTNGAAGSVTVIDVRRLVKLGDVLTGPGPVSISFSSQAAAAYVSHEDGTIVALAAGNLAGGEPGPRIVARVKAEPGLGQIAFAPGGRYAFVVNPAHDRVHILDAASNRIVQTAAVEKGPDQVTFSEDLAYVRHRDSETVLMIPLKAIGREGTPVSVMDFPGGQKPFGRGRRPSPAAGIVRAPGEKAVLVANPADEAVYFYQEGMAAPMGSFADFDRQPRAVLVIDRSLKEKAPGSYETVAKLRDPGSYDVAFFLDNPRIVHCFSVAVEPNPALARKRQAALPPKVEYLLAARTLRAGEPWVLRFRISDPVTGAPKRDLADVQVLAYQPPGNRQERYGAVQVEPGVYEARLGAGRPGSYYVFVQSSSIGLPFHRSPPLTLAIE
ncbi:MAG TPA: YncE family protein [Thermoanaerobaculia bacterium]|nr:YncE family protein [Thermoanaerobaculia bacterium]